MIDGEKLDEPGACRIQHTGPGTNDSVHNGSSVPVAELGTTLYSKGLQGSKSPLPEQTSYSRILGSQCSGRAGPKTGLQTNHCVHNGSSLPVAEPAGAVFLKASVGGDDVTNEGGTGGQNPELQDK